jgi:hypothetical protein
MYFLILLLSSSLVFAKQSCISASFEELDDLMALAESPKCKNNEMSVSPVCHSTSPQGYATLWTVTNTSGATCNDKGNFSHNLQFDNLVEEWPQGLKYICGAYWSGAGQLTLNITGSNYQMSLGASPACTAAQKAQVLGLCGLSVLPIKLVSFDVKAKTEMCVNVAFKTANEDNSRGVKVERSSNGSTFTEITEIPSSNPAGGSYSYNDCDPKSQEIYYYRLKQIDNNGQETISSVKTVKIIPEPKIFPNPASEKMNVNFNTKDKEYVNVRIVNVLGQVIVNKKYPLETNSEGIKIDVNPYASGMYFLEVRDPANNPIIKGGKGKFIIAH